MSSILMSYGNGAAILFFKVLAWRTDGGTDIRTYWKDNQIFLNRWITKFSKVWAIHSYGFIRPKLTDSQELRY